ncbi:tetratricopeptide repeat protein 21B [Erpetoichthys calabaricus]|uniref:tetratricopeptide repeat protein 21B n=1 Tax=Erpetoichthys calabaricus TaxID=27687 RepID=UPI00109EF41F|nr:tetratricopeptide repeat protein 21B [Erpetoichthys calabaricus]
MTEREQTGLASIVYYYQEKFYRHAINIANEQLKKNVNDPVMMFFKAYGALMEGRTQEAIRELNELKDHPDVSLCSIMALIYAHKQSESLDREAVSDLETLLKTSRKTAGEQVLYHAGLFLWLLGRSDKAKEYIDKMLKISSASKEGLILKGWTELSSEKELSRHKSIKYFEDGLQDSKNVFGLMGKVKYFTIKQNYSGALEIVNQIIVSHPNFLPALLMKMKLFLAQQNWEQTLETARRILQKDSTNLEALQVMAVYSLAKEGDLAKTTSHVGEIISVLETVEPCNPSLHSTILSPISKMCGNNQMLLQQISNAVERALMKAPTVADIANELGFLLLFQSRLQEASYWYSNAMKLDGNNLAALTGVIQCQLLQGQLGEAEQQLEFLREVQQSIGRSPEVAYLEAVLSARKDKGEQVVNALLNEAIQLHFSGMEGLPLGMEYFEKLNPSFLLNVVKEYLALCPQQPMSPGQPLPIMVKQSSMILEPIVKITPGLIEAVYLMAKVKFISGDSEACLSCLQRCLDLNPTFSDAHLLMAQVYLIMGNFRKCSQSLETGVSHNFEVRELPLYHLIKARTLKMMGDLPEAIKTLKMVMSLPSMRKGASAKAASASISTSDRVSVYLELAEVLRLNGELHEATKILQDAIVQFSGTSEEIRITVANVDLAISRGDTDTALGMLRNISATQPYYTQAKEKMAEIYLYQNKDKRLYVACYRELCEQLPGPHTSLLLGDAYMKIQEPEKAIEVYEQALKRNAKDATLASKTGQALIKAHQYNKAINYYEAAIKISGQEFLYYDLAELFLKLKQYDKAQKLVKQVLEHKFVTDLPTMMSDVKYLTLLARIHSKSGKSPEAMDALNKAYDVQSRVLKRLVLEQPEIIPTQKLLASSLLSLMAEQCVSQKDFDSAIKHYKEALSFLEKDSKLLISLARLYLDLGDLDSCQRQCMLLLENEEKNEEAAMMIADLMFRRHEYENAISQCRHLMERSPDNFLVLERLIDLLRRTGKLDEAPALLQKAENQSARSTFEPGYNYCKGLYLWHLGQPNEALRLFNKARKDSDWGQKAVHTMIQICLNPDNETIGGEVFENLNEDSGSNNGTAEKKESEQLAVKTAQNLLKEFHPRTKQSEEQQILLQNNCLLATKDKMNIEKALSVFAEMASSEKEHVPALLAMAQAYMILKQTPRARNQLKRINKVNWNAAEAEELEKSWLLLADIYIKAGKYDIATDLLKRCLLYNKSCCKAYEYLGFIMETEQSYKDAASNYEMAWKYSNRANPVIGYKLAFNYLKDKKYVEAIDVCRKVLNDHPGYPKIRKEILEKAQLSVKA